MQNCIFIMIHMKYTFHWAMSQGLSSQILYIYLIPCGERSDVSGIPPVLHHKEYVIDSVVHAGCWPAADRPLLQFLGIIGPLCSCDCNKSRSPCEILFCRAITALLFMLPPIHVQYLPISDPLIQTGALRSSQQTDPDFDSLFRLRLFTVPFKSFRGFVDTGNCIQTAGITDIREALGYDAD